jgi:hypothetical protein
MPAKIVYDRLKENAFDKALGRRGSDSGNSNEAIEEVA